MSDRYQHIYRVIAAIPKGAVCSYGKVADLAGVPRGARVVARALAQSPKTLCLPWHRVVRSSGEIAFPKDSAGAQEQRKRLLDEGIIVRGRRVNMRDYEWKPGVDEILFSGWTDD